MSRMNFPSVSSKLSSSIILFLSFGESALPRFSCAPDFLIFQGGQPPSRLFGVIDFPAPAAETSKDALQISLIAGGSNRDRLGRGCTHRPCAGRGGLDRRRLDGDHDFASGDRRKSPCRIRPRLSRNRATLRPASADCGDSGSPQRALYGAALRLVAPLWAIPLLVDAFDGFCLGFVRAASVRVRTLGAAPEVSPRSRFCLPPRAGRYAPAAPRDARPCLAGNCRRRGRPRGTFLAAPSGLGFFSPLRPKARSSAGYISQLSKKRDKLRVMA